MPVTININNLSLCHKASGGMSIATLPDVCKTPSPGGPVPIPYPNIATELDLIKGTTTVKADGGQMCANYGSEFFKSTGDEPGVAGGILSSTFIKEANWITYSFDVKLQGKGACRLTDKMFHNHQNTVNAAGKVHSSLATSPTDTNLDCTCNGTPSKIDPTCDAAITDSPNDGCDYYRKRQEDYNNRHTCSDCENHPAPEYYIEYGLKYCERFSSNLYPKLSPQGKEWLRKTRCALQRKMEDGLQANPEMEMNSDVFQSFAFDTHPSAYLESGLAQLSISDWWKIAREPDISDLASLEGISQAIQTGVGAIGLLINGEPSNGGFGGGGTFGGGGASGRW